jgi:hypothetical protein
MAGCWPSQTIRYRETKSDHFQAISKFIYLAYFDDQYSPSS